jgi:hypothetical protein
MIVGVGFAFIPQLYTIIPLRLRLFFMSPSGDPPTRPDKAVERSDDRLIVPSIKEVLSVSEGFGWVP